MDISSNTPATGTLGTEGRLAHVQTTTIHRKRERNVSFGASPRPAQADRPGKDTSAVQAPLLPLQPPSPLEQEREVARKMVHAFNQEANLRWQEFEAARSRQSDPRDTLATQIAEAGSEKAGVETKLAAINLQIMQMERGELPAQKGSPVLRAISRLGSTHQPPNLDALKQKAEELEGQAYDLNRKMQQARLALVQLDTEVEHERRAAEFAMSERGLKLWLARHDVPPVSRAAASSLHESYVPFLQQLDALVRKCEGTDEATGAVTTADIVQFFKTCDRLPTALADSDRLALLGLVGDKKLLKEQLLQLQQAVLANGMRQLAIGEFRAGSR